MLYKKVLSKYGASMSGAPKDPHSDLTHAVLAHYTGKDDDLIAFRRRILDAMAESKSFFLDHSAADYIDHIGDTMIREKGDLTFMRDLLLPEDVVWLEYDARALAYAQKDRREDFNTPLDEIEDLNIRGVLMDNRDPDRLFAWIFRTDSGEGLIDPLVTEEFRKDKAGFPILKSQKRDVVSHNLRYLEVASQQSGNANLIDEVEFAEEEFNTFIHLYIITYTLFATINTMKEDLNLVKTDPFSRKERKTAARFGKNYIASSPQSHLTINLNEPAKDYMSDIRKEAEERKSDGTVSPRVKHSVREHYRVYKSGKIVLVKSHERGTLEDRRPTRVTASNPKKDEGPSLEP